MQLPDLREISKKVSSQSQSLRGPGSLRGNRRSFLALQFQPCGTVKGHGTHGSGHALPWALTPPSLLGPVAFSVHPLPPTMSVPERQMDMRFAIITRARRLGAFPSHSERFSCYLHWGCCNAQMKLALSARRKSRNHGIIAITALCVNCTNAVLSAFKSHEKTK